MLPVKIGILSFGLFQIFFSRILFFLTKAFLQL